MLFTILMAAVFVGEGFSLQVDPGILAETTPEQTVALTINNQLTTYQTLAKQPIPDGMVWIGQGLNRPDLAVLGLRNGRQIFGMVRYHGTNWQLRGDAAATIPATELGSASEDALADAGREYPLSEQARLQLPTLTQPNTAPATRIDVLLIYNEVLLASMSHEEVTFALRVNLCFTNFILENSQVPLRLFPVGFHPISIPNTPWPETAYRYLFDYRGEFASLKQLRYQFRPDLTHLTFGCEAPNLPACDPNEEYLLPMTTPMSQYVIDPISFSRSILGVFGATREYFRYVYQDFPFAGAPNDPGQDEELSIGTIMSRGGHLLPFLSGSPAAKRVFTSYHNNYFAVDQFRTKVKRHRLNKVTRDNMKALLPLWGELSLIDYVKGVGVATTVPDRIIPQGLLRDNLLSKGWDIDGDGEITGDEIDNIDQFTTPRRNFEGLNMLTSLRHLYADFSAVRGLSFIDFKELDWLNLHGESEQEIFLENDTVRVVTINEGFGHTFLELGRLPFLMELNVESHHMNIITSELPWLSTLYLNAATEIHLNNGNRIDLPRLNRIKVMENDYFENQTPQLFADLNLAENHWLDLVRLDAEIDPVTISFPKQIQNLRFKGDGSMNLPSLPANNSLSHLTLLDIDAQGLEAWTLPNLVELVLIRAGLTALPELPNDRLTRLTLFRNRLTDLSVPAGYEQLENLNMHLNWLDETLCPALQTLEALIPDVYYWNQQDFVLRCPDETE